MNRTTTSTRAARRLSIPLVGILCLTLLAPLAARADTDLELGGIATVAYTNGGVVLLRAEPSWAALVLTSLPEGTVVDVLDGPLYDGGNSPWYAVVAWGQEGFLPAAFLRGDGGGGSAGMGSDAMSDGVPPTEFVAASDNTAIIAGTNNDGVRCRTEPSYAGVVVTVLAEGEAVALNGVAIGEWQPVLCAGAAGYVHADFVLIGGVAPPVQQLPPPAAPEQAPVEQAPAAAAQPAVTTFATAATGYAVVIGTNGDGVRCRSGAGFDASTITVLPEGAEVALTGAPVGVWQPVTCAGSGGYVHGDYLSASGAAAPAPVEDESAAPPEDGSFEAQASTGSAMVTGTNGGGLRCRSGAGYSASIITVLAEGSNVALRGAAQGEWQPVVCAGANGFAHVDYLIAGGSNNGGSNGGGDDGGGDGGSTGGGSTTGSATVTGTGGGGLRCRAGAGYDAGIITVLAEGASVSLRGGASGEWQPVVCAGQNGFAHVDYLTAGGGGSNNGGGNDGGTDGGSDDGSSGGGATTGSATVSGTGGGGLRCRSGAGYNAGILVVIPEGTSVSLRGAAQGEWQPVVCAGSNGFVHVDYLTIGGSNNGGNNGGDDDGDDGGSDSGNDGGGSGGLGVGSSAMTMASLNLRYEASFSAGVAAVAPSGTVVAITGGPSSGFYSVDWDGLGGWMHGDYLSWTDQPLSERGGSGSPAPNPGGTPGGSAGSPSGNSIVNFAMQYVGYPYVWAGEGPYGFDCSGFVMFVVRNVLGMNITHDMFIQYDLGTPVAYGNLQPGDIVFFQNTFRWGMSHNGIYIGNNQFVHAENESTGVRVSDITSQYYSSRYYGAVRFA